MKRIMFLFMLMPLPVLAAAPSTSCPSGYTAISTPYITIATTCPAGTVSAGTAESCLVSNPAGACIMYAPADVPYTDDYGEYAFTNPCPMS